MLIPHLNVIVYIFVTITVAVTAAICSALLGFERTGVYWLSTSIVFLVLVTVYVMTTGLIGVLSVPTLTVFSILGIAIVILVYKRQEESLGSLADQHRNNLRQFTTTVSGSVLLSALAVGFVCIIAWLIFVAYLLPPVAWDATSYHLTPVVDWMQNGEITFVYNLKPYTPKNVEVLMLWNTIFPHSQTFIKFSQMYYIPIGFLAVYVIAQEVKISPENALVSGFAFTLTPIVLIQSITAYVDLGVGALMIASIAFLIRYWNVPASRNLVLFGATTGLLLGSKASGIAYAGFLGLALGLILIRKGDNGKREIATQLAFTGALIWLLGGYWYLRNGFMFGNPIYPYSADVLGFQLLEGTVPVSARQTQWVAMGENLHGPPERLSLADKVYLSWFEKVLRYTHAPGIGGFGPQWPLLCLPGITIFGYKSARDRNERNLLLLAVFAAPLFVLPVYHSRFTIYLVGIGAVAIGYLREHICIQTDRLFALIVVILLLTSGFLSTGLNPVKYPGYIDRSASNFEKRSSMIVITDGRVPVDHETFTEYIPPCSNVGYVLKHPDHTFNLYDKQLCTKINYVGTTHSPKEFQRYLMREELQYLVLSRSSDQASWAKASNVTRSVFENSEYYIFRVDNA